MSQNKKKIIEVIAKITKIDTHKINADSCMNDFAKWDSFAHLNIMLAVEKHFKKKITTSKMSELNSVDKILKFLDN